MRPGRGRWRPQFRHPAQVIVAAFAVAVAVGTGLLMLPIAREGPGSAPLLTALFTATSAVCVTGLIVVDTPVYWSAFGQVVICGDDPGGRLRHHDPGLAGRVADLAPARSAHTVDRCRGDEACRPRRRGRESSAGSSR